MATAHGSASTRLADVVYELGNGSVVFRGGADELEADDDVKQRYPGVGV